MAIPKQPVVQLYGFTTKEQEYYERTRFPNLKNQPILSHRQAQLVLRNVPHAFTPGEFPFDERDRLLIMADQLPEVSYSNESCLSHLLTWEPDEPVDIHHQRVAWNDKNDDVCMGILADAGQLLHEFEPHATVPRPSELQKDIMVKVRVDGTSNAGFKWGFLTANGSAPGDVRIFKGPKYGDQTCDAMILRNAVPSSYSLHGTKLDRCWDVLLIKAVEFTCPWLVMSLREVKEPGGRVIHRCGTKDGAWGTGLKEECDDVSEVKAKENWPGGDSAHPMIGECARPFTSKTERWVENAWMGPHIL